jgi:hypothetical protein
MFKVSKHTLIAAAVIVAASAPSSAQARFMTGGGPPSASARAVNSQQVHNATAPFAGNASASSPQGFQWDDAGIGAAGALALVSAGSGAIVVLRRRTHHPLTS